MVALLLLASGPAGGQTAPRWQEAAELPEPRTEVAATLVNGEIVVLGGLLLDNSSSRRVDAFSPTRNRWRRLRDLPVAVNHAMAAAYRGRLYVVGGYVARGSALRGGFVLERGRWRKLPTPPEPRAAAGAAVVGGKLVVAGGVGPNGLATRAMVYDIARRRWSTAPGPTPREHIAVTAAAGRVWAIAGRLAGIDTNLTAVEAWRPGERAWTSVIPIPDARGGTGAASVGTTIVSVGGEEPGGTIASVYSLDARARAGWRRLPDLPTPRHGLGVVAVGKRVYVIGGGTSPGLTVSGANEFLTLS